MAGRVRDALGTLDPRDREVLLLAEWEGLTPAGIAKVMHCASSRLSSPTTRPPEPCMQAPVTPPRPSP
jgi:DNA-directed RNA polymerase specialized sigma24 family protein